MKKESILDKIKEEYPFITSAAGSTYRMGQIKTYYMIKQIESQKFHNRIIAILTGINILLTFINIYLAYFR